jgi:transketolase
LALADEDRHPKAHGDPFGDEEIAATKELLGLPPDQTFHVPDEVLDLYAGVRERGRSLSSGWRARLDASDVDREVYDACLEGRGLDGWEAKLPTWAAGEEVATRKASGAVLAAIADVVPGWSAGAPTSPATPARRSRATACSPPTSRAGASSTSASASTAWAPP